MSQQSVLDTGLMENLEQRFGRDVFASFIQQYLDEVDGRREQVEAAVAAQDLAALGKEVHDLTTSSGTIGIKCVYETAQACEFACKDEDKALALALGRDLPEQMRAAVSALRERYPALI